MNNALETYRAAVALRRAAVLGVNSANEILTVATLHADEQRYLATIAVACPADECGAPIGEQCKWERFVRHRYVTHEARQDAAGVTTDEPWKPTP